MPSSPRKTVLCRYHYDPLDRQNGCSVHQQPAIQRFNCKDRLATEIQGAARWSFFQHDEQLLAQLNQLYARVTSTLLATDQQRSVLNALDTNQPNPLAYTPYGHRPALNGLLSLLGFNGERPDPVTGHYHLGNGYRQFNPVLMRFNSPDSWSPFGEGGVNAYAYCIGDPINRLEVDGRSSVLLGKILNYARYRIGIRSPSEFKAVKEKLSAIGAAKKHGGISPDTPKKLIKPIMNKTSTTPTTSAISAVPQGKWQNDTSLTLASPEPSNGTTTRLSNRRTKSLDHIPEIPNAEIEAFYLARKRPEDFSTNYFAKDPDGTQARLYFAMDSEISSPPTTQIQRTIRTGGRK